MVSALGISTIIVVVCLILGAIAAGIYIAVFKSKPENQGKSFDPAVVVLIMVMSLLLGLLIVALYYLITGRECPECMWGAEDAAELKKAEDVFDTLQTKANRIPRNLNYSAACDGDPSGGTCGIKTKHVAAGVDCGTKTAVSK